MAFNLVFAFSLAASIPLQLFCMCVCVFFWNGAAFFRVCFVVFVFGNFVCPLCCCWCCNIKIRNKNNRRIVFKWRQWKCVTYPLVLNNIEKISLLLSKFYVPAKALKLNWCVPVFIDHLSFQCAWILSRAHVILKVIFIARRLWWHTQLIIQLSGFFLDISHKHTLFFDRHIFFATIVLFLFMASC